MADTMLSADELEPYLDHLRRLPFVRAAKAEVSGVAQADGGVDAMLRLKTRKGTKTSRRRGHATSRT